jgi:putative hydrolase of the HAD superfamily
MPCFCDREQIRRVVVFDLDDTLYLERDYAISGLAAVGAWAHRQLGLPGLGANMLARFKRGERTGIFDAALTELGHPASPDLIGRMLAVYRQHRPRIALAPDAAALLDDPPRKTAFAIITDGYLDAQRRKLRALKVGRHGVRLAVCTDRWGRDAWKPNARAFEHVQKAFGLGPDRYTYVADNPAKDFHAPLRLGWQTVRVMRPERLHQAIRPGDVEADRTILDLRQL